MDAEISQSEQWLRFQVWLEDNWRRVAAIASVVTAVGIVVAFVVWQGAQKQRNTSEALSLLLASPEGVSAEALSSFAGENAGTDAGTRALVLAGGKLFTEGNYPEAQARFEQLLSTQPTGAFNAKARLGVAACKEAQGQTDAAISDYKSILDHSADPSVVLQARFALGGLYVLQGQPDLARAQYEALLTAQGSSLAAEAQARLAELPPSLVSRQVEVPSLTTTATATNQP